ncbi:hypothetical protein GobsT_69970 [Gemmata obscuriglobus]|uniref:DUF1549 domain-containing protein n=1 Tax=Gemmata obscuriglobus TaxID=114 RepID=A0A2Z3H775_9BACT|nr:DUF1549 and DUF1553 domain-containing protein [Gemmata obscuriglobus]AWM41883.1 DUF1549 domain-containing protein [Gemmata obscuriglobus]QEG32145.1 hypothetical protein GobsT_69970 [Gemmata obscuriglobus]VTS11498.1 Uncharacterized protein OS=Singulisphaera acidiphila (strain ATCC BAA-1392 / DSM 18658 / VKM B-2454 / MOB10) GN=Sinac_2309 PE=4 SV=1: PSCyt2: PSD1 [Gemmata obscuriglobus UQM 2246]
MRFKILFALLLVSAGAPARAADVSFEREVLPVLTRAGCNMGACHGNLNGKGGLKLSLKGEDPAGDHAVLTRDMLARRTDPIRPDESLLLQKATAQVPHEGGARFTKTSSEYVIVREWIANGCKVDAPGAPTLTKLVVTPGSKVLVEPADRFHVKAVAHFSDGTTRDVTSLAAFEFTQVGVAKVGGDGEVVREQPGEVVLLVRYHSIVEPVRVVFLPHRPVPEMSNFRSTNKIDTFVISRLQELRIKPAELAPDYVFLRRAYLDALGVLPAPAETRAFLADADPKKRERLIDALLARPEFAEFWAQKWSDLLRNEEKALDKKGVAVFFRWIAAQLAADRPLNEFARDVLAAKGSTYENPPANFWRAVRDPLARSESVAQVFLGVRIGCARCHNHPFDRWTTDDYYSFGALFARVDYRVLENSKRDALDSHEFVGEQVVWQNRTAEMTHPRTRRPAPPRFLGARTPDVGGDRLGAVADWVAAPDNPFFARAQVNRVWLHLMGRGLVDPNDDFRATNPPSNPELLEWLAADFAKHKFSLKHAVRTVMTSRTYQLAATARDRTTMGDELHHSHATVQPLEAEQLLDALSSVTGVPVRFAGYPVGLRANQIPAPPQSGRRGFDGMGEKFLKTFGKPERLLTCECERNDDPGLLQAFQLITGELINALVKHHDGRLGKGLSAGRTDAEMLDEFYLAALCRKPTPVEEKKLLAYLAGATDRRAAWEDVLWALLNSKEFLLRR